MPKIEVYKDTLYSFMGREMSLEELDELLPTAKAELDDYDEDEGIIKIELNDTNRPDLWSTAGLGRQLRVFLSGQTPDYSFCSTEADSLDSSDRLVEVDPGLCNIRPFVAAFAVTGKPIDESALKDIIQTQEKLCWNFGQKRKSIAMGVYRSDLISYPVKFLAADPDSTRFVPLQMEDELSLREIIEKHPKGHDFGHIVADFAKFPFLTDSEGEVLSFPPIINSSRLGAVQIGDENLFIEMTGTDLRSILLAISIVACDMTDYGFTILPVKTVYPYDTEFGREIVSPYYFQQGCTAEIGDINRMLGDDFTLQEAAGYARKMGLSIEVGNSSLTVVPPVYRNDFLHAVDLIEDIMIGRGTNEFEPVLPKDFTPGRLSEEEIFARGVKDVLVGLGYQEMIFNYLGSGKDYIEKMCIAGDKVVQIANPMTENYEFVRNSILPSMLGSEAVSAHAVYPHQVFEIGKVAYLDSTDNQGSVTRNWIGFMTADREANFNDLHSTVSTLFYYLSKEYTLTESEDPRYITGRCADIIFGDQKVGSIGEVNPQVLVNWGIEVPCAACEIDLDYLLAVKHKG
ncbi:MAG: phenylalanine--tRNA ligase subunit beta [Spirochaetales bacterium]|jgi:phenylalanyl-tRNA synthetase beta chain|nr:phenylalanine--tRNA ligase subunit beta [Spirochaetales bacterium]